MFGEPSSSRLPLQITEETPRPNNIPLGEYVYGIVTNRLNQLRIPTNQVNIDMARNLFKISITDEKFQQDADTYNKIYDIMLVPR